MLLYFINQFIYSFLSESTLDNTDHENWLRFKIFISWFFSKKNASKIIIALKGPGTPNEPNLNEEFS